MNEDSPRILKDLVMLNECSRETRTSEQLLLKIPFSKKYYIKKTMSIYMPHRNDLPQNIKMCKQEKFKKNAKSWIIANRITSPQINLFDST